MKPSLQDREKLVYHLIDNADVLVFYLDINGNVLVFNKKIESITAVKKEDITGKHWLNILYGSNIPLIKQQMFKAIIDDSITYKRPNSFEGVIIDTNKSDRLISWSVTPILADHQELDGLLLIGNDITEFKETEASFKKIDETLKNIFSSIKEYALYVINLDGNITYFGMGSEHIFAWKKSEIIFKHINILHTEEDAKSKLPFILERVRQIGRYELSEIDLVKRDGQRIPVMLSVTQFLDPDGKLIGYIFIAKDITETKKLEYQIIQSEKLAAIGQLAAGMAHEINNPLFVISGRVEMILEQKKLPAKTKETLVTINAQAERIRKLVDRLLKFARQTPPRLDIININDVIESALSFVSYHKISLSNIELEKHMMQDLPPIKGDLNQLQEVFVNLFINAYQAMAQGGKLSIRTSVSPHRFIEIVISDTGPGISSKNLKNVFMPFFSTKKEGTGLGLSICYNIIKSHNGFIDVTSEEYKGTTFIIRLPVG